MTARQTESVVLEGSFGWKFNRSAQTRITALRSRTLNPLGARGIGGERRLDVLLALAEAYEDKRWPIDMDENFDPIDVLNHPIDEFGHTQAELAELLGSRSRASEILSRRRALTVDIFTRSARPPRPPGPALPD